MGLKKLIKEKFKVLHQEEPLLFRSPGRVNLIGEHTDYNNGFVLPAAIEKAIYFAISKRDDSEVNLYAYNLNESDQFNISNPNFIKGKWSNYLKGVVDQLNKMGCKFNGFNCVFGGDIPIGAGLSSSAALEAGLAFALNHIFNLGLEKLTIVKLAQKAENEFVGMNCGIMDQYINVFGKSGNVVRIDCQSLDYEYFPFDFKDLSIVLFNSLVTHSLASSEYNKRREECNLGVAIIQKKYPEVKSLRDVSEEMLREVKDEINDVVYKRCKYAVEETDRVIKACDSLIEKDLKKFGKYMFQTHEGLSKDYEVSCEEMDYLVELTKGNEDILGARMMGGGFGGCTINLIKNSGIEKSVEYISQKYKSRYGKELEVYITTISNGTELLSDN
ncbi:MAG: galactokinase [Melioribacteraceae bacterium]|nr:galactokinase [Melioribacteraceae bacterium]